MTSLMMKSVRVAACLLAGLPAMALATVPVSIAPPRFEPRPLIIIPPGKQPVRLSEARVETEIHAGLARTKLTLELINPNPTAIEGEVQFPLHDGQIVDGFSLEMTNGTMMKAVPVAKAKGRQVFEAVERRGVDPALLEQTSGEQFRLRVFPLMPNAPRHVEIVLTQAVTADAARREILRLPLDFGTTVAEKLTLSLALPAIARQQVRLGRDLEGAEMRQESGQILIALTRANFRSKADNAQSASLSWPDAAKDDMSTSRIDGDSYFQASLAVDAPLRARPLPDRILLLWDASASGGERDHAREFQFLDQLFRWQPDLAVQLKIVRESAEPERDFTIRGGDWHGLRETLERVVYDGASNAGLWRPDAAFSPKNGLVLLFSDGIGNWGEEAGAQSWSIPSFAIRASATGNSLWLHHWAEAHQGQFIDLGQTDPGAAMATLRQMPLRLAGIEGEGIRDWESAGRIVRQGRIAVAGRLTESVADPVVLIEDGTGKILRKPLHIVAPPAGQDSPSDFAAKRWASLRMDALLAEPRLHKREIQSLGEKFSLVSPETSLIVLETLADFVRYEVRPPAGPMRVSYDQTVQRGTDDKKFAHERHRDDLARRYAEFIAWWERDFPKGDVKQPEPVKKAEADTRSVTATQTAAPVPPPPPPPPMPAPVIAPKPADSPVTLAMPMAVPPPAPAPRAAAAAPAPVADPVAPASTISVALQPWSPDNPYQQRLNDADDGERYAVYLDERLAHKNSVPFYLDAAEIFARHGQKDVALRILSNLAELSLEDRGMLRILAYRLQGMDQAAEAVRVLRHVADLAPDEPQSWRDLGLAYKALNEPQKAIEALWRTADGVWDQRFGDIDLIALGELNAIAATNPSADVGMTDPRLRRNLPLDLRVVLAWDADNTDLDLWVKDPNGEWTSYQQNLSYQGGRISRDCTQGYGPEAYSLRIAKPGTYEVRAKYYGSRQTRLSGPPTLMLRLTKGFGTGTEENKEVILRLENVKEEVMVGTFMVEGSGK